jgi:hypothetical protein
LNLLIFLALDESAIAQSQFVVDGALLQSLGSGVGLPHFLYFFLEAFATYLVVPLGFFVDILGPWLGVIVI